MEPGNPLRERINGVADMDTRLWMLISSLIIIEFYRYLEQITRLDKAISIRYQCETIWCLRCYLCFVVLFAVVDFEDGGSTRAADGEVQLKHAK